VSVDREGICSSRPTRAPVKRIRYEALEPQRSYKTSIEQSFTTQDANNIVVGLWSCVVRERPVVEKLRAEFVGKQFGSRTVIAIERVFVSGRYRNHARTICKCGTETYIDPVALRKGKNIACMSCSKAGVPRTHGQSKTPMYSIWHGMVQRCTNARSTSFKRYGGRGITVCDAWRTSFEAFARDVGPRPSKLHSIDRIDNSGNYEPGNVRWATIDVQLRNTRRNVHATVGGVSMVLKDAAKATGVSYCAAQNRLASGYSMTEALDAKRLDGHRDATKLEIDGKRLSVREIAIEYEVKFNTLTSRLARGWSIERAVSKDDNRRNACSRRTQSAKAA
jgi:hypothetical protein